MIDQDYDSIFYNKKDDNYYPLSPNEINFFDMFAKKKLKCKEIIPETICVLQGQAKFWFFNSKKDPRDTSILKKN